MKDEAIPPERILEAIEACRPQGDDMSDPMLGPLAEQLAGRPEWEEILRRSRRLDTVLVDVFRDVPVPDELEQRILERLASAVSVAGCPPEPATAVVVRRRRPARRWWWLLAGSAVAACVLVVVFVRMQSPGDYGKAEVLDVAMAFFDEGATQSDPLAPERRPAVLADYPISRDVLQPPGTRWRAIRGFLDRRGVAYDMKGWGGRRATLVVVHYRRAIAGLPSKPPPRPLRTTGGQSAVAWQTDGLLYVLVVDGRQHVYRRFLNLPRGPLT